MSGFWQRYPVLMLLLPLVAFILLADSLGLRLWQGPNDDRLPMDTTLTWLFLIDDVPTERAKTWRIESGAALLYLQKDSTRPAPRLGDSIRIVTRLRSPEPLGTFDYPRYLRRQGITATGYVRAEDWQVTAHTPPSSVKTRPLPPWRHSVWAGARTSTMTHAGAFSGQGLCTC